MLITQKFIFRVDLRANPKAVYLFGDNLLRVGLGGQAKEMRGEPNAIGIATKVSPGMLPEDFFSDDLYDTYAKTLIEDFEPAFRAAEAGKLIVVPHDGLGTGLSELPTRAPRLNKVLLDKLTELRIAAK